MDNGQAFALNRLQWEFEGVRSGGLRLERGCQSHRTGDGRAEEGRRRHHRREQRRSAGASLTQKLRLRELRKASGGVPSSVS